MKWCQSSFINVWKFLFEFKWKFTWNHFKYLPSLHSSSGGFDHSDHWPLMGSHISIPFSPISKFPSCGSWIPPNKGSLSESLCLVLNQKCSLSVLFRISHSHVLLFEQWDFSKSRHSSSSEKRFFVAFLVFSQLVSY